MGGESHTFFNKGKQKKPLQEANIKRFLQTFPENEFWRFFVERSRYDDRRQIYRFFLRRMIPEMRIRDLEEIDSMSVSKMENKFKQYPHKKFTNCTIDDLYEIAVNYQDQELIYRLDKIYHLGERGKENVADYVNKHKGWLGFEEKEPGYLPQITKAFVYAIEQIGFSHAPLTIKLIKKLHHLATTNVKDMIEGNQPGEFREQADVQWEINKTSDSVKGLEESIDYLKSLEEYIDPKCNIFGYLNGDQKIYTYSSLFEQESKTLAEEVIRLESSGRMFWIGAEFSVEENKQQSEVLELIGKKQIQALEQDLKNAQGKNEKLTSIFKYLKHAVLLHPFTDGVGRTYSMVLLQSLLVRENLLPVLIENSNSIPGLSVQELVDEYSRAEKEMELILSSPTHISSEKMVQYNIDTAKTLSTLEQSDKEVFNKALLSYQEMKKAYLNLPEEDTSETAKPPNS